MLINLFFQFITLLSFFSNIYILFFLFIIGYLEIVSEGFVVLSLVAIFTQGFSANIRNIYLGSNVFNIKKVVLLRILFGVIGFILVNLLTYVYIGKSHILFHSSIILLTTTNWIIELFIARHEKNRIFNIYHIVNLFFLLFMSVILIFLQNILFLSLMLYCISLFNILIFKNFFKSIFSQNIIIKKFILNLGYFSTLFKTIVNFFWRYFSIILIGKSDASLLFVGFALGSFFGTLFDISYGAKYLKKIKNVNFFISIFFIIYIILVSLFIYFIRNFFFMETEQFNFFINSTVFSICGGYLSVFALHQRQLFFEKKEFREICYKADIFIYLINFFIIPILYYFNREYLIISFFVSSMCSYIVYIIFIKNVYSRKIV
jgi:NADH:ubiquinone oxidoreductase subunit K